ncbi:MAG: flippase [Candidatus Firestonebacteria bacterium]
MDFKKVVKNTGILISGRFVTILIYIFITVCLTRYLGSVEFGKYSLVYAYLSFFTLISIFGIDKIIVKEIVQDSEKASELIGTSLILCAVLSSISIILSLIIVNFLNYPAEIKNFIYIASLGLFFISASAVYTSVFQAHLQQKYQVIVEVISKTIAVLVVIFLILLKAKLLYFFILDVFIAIVILFGNKFFAKYFIKPKFNIDLKIWLSLLKNSWPLALSSFFTIIIMRIDQMILYQAKGFESVGLYSAIVRIVESFNIIPVAFGLSVFPLLTKHYLGEKALLRDTYEKSLKYISFIMVPIVILIAIFSKYIIFLLYGKQFLASQNALFILMWSSLWYFTGVLFAQVLLATGNQKFILISASSDALFNVVLNLILIPKYGIIGASIATTISYIAGRITCYILFKEIRWYVVASLKCLLKPLIYFLPPGIILYLLISA